MIADQFQANASTVNGLANYLFRSERVAAMRDIARLNEDFTKLPTDPLFTYLERSGTEATVSKFSGDGTSLKEAFDQYRNWTVSTQTSPKTIAKHDYVWRLLSDMFGPDYPVQSFDRSDARRFADIVTRLPPKWTDKPDLRNLSAPEAANKAVELGIAPCHPNTAKGYVAKLSTFLGFLENEDVISKNVARGLLKAERRGRNRRKGAKCPLSVNKIGAWRNWQAVCKDDLKSPL